MRLPATLSKEGDAKREKERERDQSGGYRTNEHSEGTKGQRVKGRKK